MAIRKDQRRRLLTSTVIQQLMSYLTGRCGACKRREGTLSDPCEMCGMPKLHDEE